MFIVTIFAGFILVFLFILVSCLSRRFDYVNNRLSALNPMLSSGFITLFYKWCRLISCRKTMSLINQMQRYCIATRVCSVLQSRCRRGNRILLFCCRGCFKTRKSFEKHIACFEMLNILSCIIIFLLFSIFLF